MKIRSPHLAIVLAGALTLGFAPPALAEDAPDAATDDTATEDTERHVDLDALKHRCNRFIERRLGDLASASDRLDEVGVLTDDHAATLDGIIDSTVGALTTLQADIIAAPDAETTLRLCRTIAPDYRVYLVVLPQTHLTIGADRVDTAVATSEQFVEGFAEAVERALEAGADVTEAVALMDLSTAHIAAADAANDGVADSVLAVTPSSFNDGPGHEALDAARAAVRTSRSELSSAKKDGRAAVQALRDAIENIPGSPGV